MLDLLCRFLKGPQITYIHTEIHGDWLVFQVTLILFINNLRSCDIGTTNGRDFGSKSLRWPQMA
jgi:hypothetical protein